VLLKCISFLLAPLKHLVEVLAEEPALVLIGRCHVVEPQRGGSCVLDRVDVQHDRPMPVGIVPSRTDERVALVAGAVDESLHVQKPDHEFVDRLHRLHGERLALDVPLAGRRLYRRLRCRVVGVEHLEGDLVRDANGHGNHLELAFHELPEVGHGTLAFWKGDFLAGCKGLHVARSHGDWGFLRACLACLLIPVQSPEERIIGC